MAGALGIEPRLAGSKSAELPLFNTPIVERYFYTASLKAACFEGVAEPARIVAATPRFELGYYELTVRFSTS